MRAVNLLPVEERGGRRRPPATALAIAGVGVLLASVLAVAFFSAGGKVDKREQELARYEQQIADARSDVAKAKARIKPSHAGLTAERDQRLTALNDALAQRLAWDRVLRDVSLVLPDDVWLSKLTAGAGAAEEAADPAATTGVTLTFTGFTYSQRSVARLLSRLGLAPELENVRLQQSSVTEVGERELFGFTVLADVKSPGGAS